MNPRGCDRRPPSATPSGRRWAHRDDRGAAAVELALVLPVLLLVLFLIVDLGRVLSAQITLTEAARQGARAAALGLTQDEVDERVRQATIGLSPTPVFAPEADCTVGGLDANAIGSVSHSFQPITPIGGLIALFGGTEDGSALITARGVMPCVG